VWRLRLAVELSVHVLRQFARKLSAEELFGFRTLERFDHAENITLLVNNAKRY
jgi:hypothetical protein